MELSEKLARIELGNRLTSLQAVTAIKYCGCGLEALQELKAQKKLPRLKFASDPKQVDPETVIVFGEADYPKLLAEIPDPPLTLFYKGDKSILSSELKLLAMVGTRKVSSYGTQLTELFTRQAVQQGLVTVSGLAFGVDTLVHEITLRNKGRTVAVLGTGVNQPYPRYNNYLYDRIIAEGGVVVSEFLNTNGYNKWVFPRRNRIIAGLCEATMVIEAPSRSGALLTANLAAGYNRRVFTAPGSLFLESIRGNLDLLARQQAEMIRSIHDIYPEMAVTSTAVSSDLSGLAPDQLELLKLLPAETQLVKLRDILDWDLVKLMQVVGELEISGRIALEQGQIRLVF